MRIPGNTPAKPPVRGPLNIPVKSPAKFAAKRRWNSALELPELPREGPGKLRVKWRARCPGRRGARDDSHPQVFEDFARSKPKSRALEKLKEDKKRRG